MDEPEANPGAPTGALRPAPAEPTERVSLARERIVIRTYPKTVFMYPTALTALLAGVLGTTGLVNEATLGFIFCVVLFFNLLVISFEFRKHTPVVLLLVGLVVVLGGVLLNERLALVSTISSLYARLHLTANPQFYFGVAAAFFVLFFLIAIDTRFDYWEVRGNEILHHTGFLGDCERFPAQSMRVRKEITDIFEYLLLLSGRLIIYPRGRDQAIVLDHVPRINQVERRMEAMLDATHVTIEKES